MWPLCFGSTYERVFCVMSLQVSSVGIQKPGSSSVIQKVGVERLSGSGEGMLIANLQMFSGMVPSEKSLESLKGPGAACNGAVKRVDYDNDEVAVYIDKLAVGDGPCVLDVELLQDMVVDNLQPAAVEVYEYYDPQKSGAAEVSPVFAEDDSAFIKDMSAGVKDAVSPAVVVASAMLVLLAHFF